MNRRAVFVVDYLSQTLLNFTELGDPAILLVLENVTVQVAKTFVEQLDNTTIVTRQGSLQLSLIASLIDVEPEGCVQHSIFFASFNPHMYVESADEVNSNTLRFDLDTCDSVYAAQRRSRRSIGDEAGACLSSHKHWVERAVLLMRARCDVHIGDH